MTRCKPLQISILGLLLSSPSLAADREVPTARSHALGHTGAAHHDDNAAITANPAAMALAEQYTLLGSFQLGTDLDYDLIVAVRDSQTGPVALGLSYRREISDPDPTVGELPGWVTAGEEFTNRKRYNDLTLALGYGFAERRFTVGASGTLTWTAHDLGGKKIDGDLDVGIAATPVIGWTVGLVGQNLLPLSDQREFPAGILLGNRYDFEDIGFVALDLGVRLEGVDGEVPLSARLGLAATPGDAGFQLGYRFEGPEGLHWWSVGAEYRNDRAGMGYAMAMPLNDGKLRLGSLVHQVSIWIRG